VAHHAVHLVPINVPWEDHDTILGVLSGIVPEVVVLAGSFQEEVSLMRTRSRWPRTVRVVAAIAAGLGDFFAELGQEAEGVVGPSQWERCVIFPDITGPGSDWFLDSFQRKFGEVPDYIGCRKFRHGTGFVGVHPAVLFPGPREATRRSLSSGLQHVLRKISHRFANRNTDRTQRVAHPLARRPQNRSDIVT
jgi:hypothetical protein